MVRFKLFYLLIFFVPSYDLHTGSSTFSFVIYITINMKSHHQKAVFIYIWALHLQYKLYWKRVAFILCIFAGSC